jgi:hypothetical protein
MPTLSFITKYQKNTGLLLSPADILGNYLYGFNIVAGNGTVFSNENILFYIEAAQKEIERYLSMKFIRQLYDDNATYYRDDYMNSFPMIKTNYPVTEPLSLHGFYKRVEQISYPKEWLSSTKNSDSAYQRRISIIPTTGTLMAGSGAVILSGVTTQYGSLRQMETLPDYWQYQYVTGYDADNIPMELVNVVGKLASIGLANIMGDLILGAGIASQSLSVDGLSQSISSTSSATNSGLGARIVQYTKEIKETLKRVEVIYKGISFRSF